MSMDRAFSLWKHYNELLLKYHDQHGFPVLSFDVSSEEYAEAVKRVSEYLQLPGLREKPEEPPFLDDELRHVDLQDLDLPDDLAQLYSRLLSIYRST
jgi:hypothetical protein